ncbi:trypsin-like peptidase domain-containing protein [Leeuwenhoekiella sp. A16]|uniref:trypsin-like peptidase domain-containing protein n=1 Tax=unclassified Leeuwenhoekiella TaxID=2615029 RepID=UPI003A803ACE
MKKFASLLIVAVLGGGITLGAYKYLESTDLVESSAKTKSSTFLPVAYNGPTITSTNADFTEAAERTVHAVVHVKNVQLSRRPRNMHEYIYGGGDLQPGLVGSGSGVIISADGYIVTNNHVIDGASEIEVSLNDNRTFKADVIGSDPKADIALIKIDAGDDLSYLPFGDSDSVRLGEWALAVGNPFNLTSTVTAGIISAKARDINEFDNNPQSFIQTDAAINPGNSGGALVNINGELIGINTAITSQTGSYVGYAFAVPSNIAKKIVQDIMEYGDVQRGILGVSGMSLNTEIAKELEVDQTEGFYVGGLEYDSGAEKAGIKKGDVIKEVDGIHISKFTDLSGYLNAKRPNDVVQVKFMRDGKEKTVPVTLFKLETYKIGNVGLEVKNASARELKDYGVKHGVVINNTLTEDMQRYNLRGIVITEIDDEAVSNINDVEKIMSSKSSEEPISITFVNKDGERNRFIFR